MQNTTEETRVELSIVKGTTSGKLTFTDTDLEIAEDTTEEQYAEGMQLFRWFMDKTTIYFSKYVAWGRLKFGVGFVDGLLEQMEFELNDVRKAIDISTVPTEIRQPNLTSEHLLILGRSKLPIRKMTSWAKKASEQNLTPADLKASIREGEVVSASSVRESTHGIISLHGVRANFDILIRRMEGFEGIKKMTDKEQRIILDEIAPIGELYNQLNALLLEKAGVSAEA